MKHTLVGYTGFVGGNLAASHPFDGLYNSKNIHQSFGQNNGLVVYSGMPSEKFLANKDPEADLAVAHTAFQNIQRMRPEKLVLISTVDVYQNPRGVDEDTPAGGDGTGAYGANRCQLETWVREAYPKALIVRLPGLFGRGIKKNFIYDMITITPAALTPEKYGELAKETPLVAESYVPGAGGFYRLVPLDAQRAAALRSFYKDSAFNALCFTDGRSRFQFYNLAHLWGHIQACLAAGFTLVNLATAPLEAATLYRHIYGKPFANKLQKPPANYNMRTKHAPLLGGAGGYLASEEQLLCDIAAFVRGQTFDGGAI